MKTWLTSDTHFGHKNIIEYCKRPFSSVEEMDKVLIERWNARVNPYDRVFHLGDFALGPYLAHRVTEIRSQLNGYITLILGNHDRSRTFYKACGFDEVSRSWSGCIQGLDIRMAHEPPTRPTLDEEDLDLILCGHIHNKWQCRGKVVNVGMDVWDYAPVAFETLVSSVKGPVLSWL